ncbi:MAG: ABC transporter permease [Methanomicrobiaceae archaeon]|nr:ABC transporter permease [Methanomicrobiaceae archaeon]
MILDDIFFSLSVRNVRLHFVRSVLAAIGIVIGVVAITSIGILGANMTLSITAELSESGNIIMVSPGGGGGGGMMMAGGGSSDDEDSFISEKQLSKIEKAVSTGNATNTVIAMYSDSDTFYVGSDKGHATIYGADMASVADIVDVEDGSFPGGTSGVVIGPTLAGRYDLEVGSRIKIGDEDESQTTVRVTGILEERGMSMDLNSDNAIIATEKWFTSFYGGEGEYDQVNIIAGDIDEIDFLEDAIDHAVNYRVDEDDQLNIQDSGSMVDTISSTIGTIVTFMMAIGAISLLVAAVSIFNVMLMSVTERIKEIGILRSIGTRRSEIRRMFLYESMILGVIGAGIGSILSFIGGYSLTFMMLGTTEYFFDPSSIMYVPIGMLVGITICVISGVYPAWSAANMDPIDALRAD